MWSLLKIYKDLQEEISENNNKKAKAFRDRKKYFLPKENVENVLINRDKRPKH